MAGAGGAVEGAGHDEEGTGEIFPGGFGEHFAGALAGEHHDGDGARVGIVFLGLAGFGTADELGGVGAEGMAADADAFGVEFVFESWVFGFDLWEGVDDEGDVGRAGSPDLEDLLIAEFVAEGDGIFVGGLDNNVSVGGPEFGEGKIGIFAAVGAM